MTDSIDPQTAYEPPPARQILEAHGVPEDVIDGVLALYAQEMAAWQRNVHDTMWPYFHMGQPCSPAFDCHVAKVIDTIDPTRADVPAAPSAAVSPPPATDRAAVLREAADLAESLRQFEPAFGARKSAQVSENVGILRVAEELRRLAAGERDEQQAQQGGCPHGCDTSTCPCLACEDAEEQQPETQAEEVALLRLTVGAVEEGRRELRSENARLRAQLWTLAAALDGLHTLIATSSRDWGTYRVDAWLWAVLVGWDCEEAHEHDELCEDGAAMAEMQERHGWSDEAVAKARRYRAAVHALTAPAVVAEPGKGPS